MNSFAGIPTIKAHVALNVRNVEEAITFYRRMFGVEPVKVRRGYAKFDLDNPALNFTLNEVPIESAGALSHLGIQVASTAEVNAVRDGWINAGLVPREEMNTVCCFARQDKAWVKDPDGNEWEVFTVLEDHLPETSGYDACCGSGAALKQKAETGRTAVVACCEPGCC